VATAYSASAAIISGDRKLNALVHVIPSNFHCARRT
jgi:hypothetical protein